MELKKIIIRVDGGHLIGMGHISRMLLLADFINKHYGYKILFIVKEEENIVQKIIKKGFRVFVIPRETSKNNELKKIKKIVLSESPESIIIDVLGCSSDNNYLHYLKTHTFSRIISFTDIHSRLDLSSADIVINSSILQLKYNYNDCSNDLYVGPKYILLSPEYEKFNKYNVIVKSNSKDKKIFICMGGVDHNNITKKILSVIDNSEHLFEINVFMSSKYSDMKALEVLSEALKHKVKIYYDVPGVCSYLHNSYLAITAGGNVHMERVCAGVPGLSVSQEEHQSASMLRYEKLGAVCYIGSYDNLNESYLLESFDKIYEDVSMQNKMIKAGYNLIDCQGIRTVANIVIKN